MDFEILKKDIEKRVFELVEPVTDYNNMELVLVEFVKGPRGNTLRLVLDKEGGITLDDCTRISRIVSDLLDVHDPVPGSYNLEVSSPGINRPLVKEKDYKRFSGEKVFVQTQEPIEGRRRFKGLLRGIENSVIQMEVDGKPFVIPLDLIKKARLDIL